MGHLLVPLNDYNNLNKSIGKRAATVIGCAVNKPVNLCSLCSLGVSKPFHTNSLFWLKFTVLFLLVNSKICPPCLAFFDVFGTLGLCLALFDGPGTLDGYETLALN